MTGRRRNSRGNRTGGGADRERKDSGQVIDLVITSLHGVSWKAQDGEHYSQLPRITAAVAFTGSATNMQISSSSMCNRTGHLVIESECTNIDLDEDLRFNVRGGGDEDKDWDDEENTVGLLSLDNTAIDEPRPLILRFRKPSDEPALASPHVKLYLPQQDSAPSTKITRANRDSRVVSREASKLSIRRKYGVVSNNNENDRNTSYEGADDDDDGNDSVDSGAASCNDTVNGSRGPSLIWSNAHFMPEIVELHVSVFSEDCDEVLEGIAHLVVFSNHQDYGRFTLDLPIKRKGLPTFASALCSKSMQTETPTQSETEENDSTLTLAQDAYIRVQLNVITDRTAKTVDDDWDKPLASTSSISTSATEMSSSGSVSIFSNDRVNEAKLNEILEQIKANEDLALARCKAARMQIKAEQVRRERAPMQQDQMPPDIPIPMMGVDPSQPRGNRQRRPFSRVLFCDTMVIGEAIEAFTDALTPPAFRRSRRNSNESTNSHGGGTNRRQQHQPRRNSVELGDSIRERGQHRHILLNKRLSSSPRLGSAPGVVSASSTMGSTIATRESLNI